MLVADWASSTTSLLSNRMHAGSRRRPDGERAVAPLLSLASGLIHFIWPGPGRLVKVVAGDWVRSSLAVGVRSWSRIEMPHRVLFSPAHRMRSRAPRQHQEWYLTFSRAASRFVLACSSDAGPCAPASMS